MEKPAEIYFAPLDSLPRSQPTFSPATLSAFECSLPTAPLAAYSIHEVSEPPPHVLCSRLPQSPNQVLLCLPRWDFVSLDVAKQSGTLIVRPMRNANDGKNVNDGDRSHSARNSEPSDRLLPPRGDYHTL